MGGAGPTPTTTPREHEQIVSVGVTFRIAIDGPAIETGPYEAATPTDSSIADVEYTYELPRYLADGLVGCEFTTSGTDWEVIEATINADDDESES